ncbi:MAG: radical SAM protein [archaeon]
MRKVYIETNGCAVLRHETQRYAKFFRENGFVETISPDNAEFVLMTTCGVVNWTEDKAIEALERLVQTSRKDAKILVGGCLPKINPERIKKISNKLVMFGPKEPYILNDLIDAKIGIEKISYTDGATREHSFGDPEIEYTPAELEQLKISKKLDQVFGTKRFLEIYDYLTKGRHFWKEENLLEIKVSSGCAKNCTYCATKFAIGSLVSENPEKIVSEVKEGLERGFKKIVLLGDEVGYYGADIGTNLISLIDSLDKLPGEPRIALRYVDPDALIKNFENLKKHFESGRIYYLCSAFQSGSHKILSLMNRTQNMNRFTEVFSEIDRDYPAVFKHTQLIVGFPQETEEDFKQTINVLDKSNFDYITATAYRDRSNTKSSQLPDHIEESIINERYQRMTEIVQKNRETQLRRRIRRELASRD